MCIMCVYVCCWLSFNYKVIINVESTTAGHWVNPRRKFWLYFVSILVRSCIRRSTSICDCVCNLSPSSSSPTSSSTNTPSHMVFFYGSWLNVCLGLGFVHWLHVEIIDVLISGGAVIWENIYGTGRGGGAASSDTPLPHTTNEQHTIYRENWAV